MEIDNYNFYPPTRTETINGERVRKLMAVHKVTGETFFFSAGEIDAMRQPNNAIQAERPSSVSDKPKS